jgi:hypothetical protein
MAIEVTGASLEGTRHWPESLAAQKMPLQSNFIVPYMKTGLEAASGGQLRFGSWRLQRLGGVADLHTKLHTKGVGRSNEPSVPAHSELSLNSNRFRMSALTSTRYGVFVVDRYFSGTGFSGRFSATISPGAGAKVTV